MQFAMRACLSPVYSVKVNIYPKKVSINIDCGNTKMVHNSQILKYHS